MSSIQTIYNAWKKEKYLEKENHLHYSSCRRVCKCRELSNALERVINVLRSTPDFLFHYLSFNFDRDFVMYIALLDTEILL